MSAAETERLALEAELRLLRQELAEAREEQDRLEQQVARLRPPSCADERINRNFRP